jgi:uncharacterized membrane protein
VGLLAIFVALAVLFAPIGAVMALSRIGDLRRRVQTLELELARMRRAAPEQRNQPASAGAVEPAAGALPPLPTAPLSTAPLPVEPPSVRRAAEPAELVERDVAAATPISAPIGAPATAAEATGPKETLEEPRTEPRAANAPVRPRVSGAGLERWLGVRGSAVVGGLAAAAAALLFFRHAFEHGWVTKPMRVGLGFAAGGTLIGVGLLLVRRAYRYAPQALVGAGLTTLYAACWAASRRYELWSTVASWIAMAAVTGLAVVLALRLRSQAVGVLGLLGGFATPLVVESHFDGPWRLFVYVLLLDVGLLEVARRREWKAFLPLALAGSLLLHVVLVARDFDPADHLSLLATIGSLAFVFAFGGRRRSADESEDVVTSASRALALLAPLGFALHFALRTDFSAPPWTVGVLGAFTAIGAAVLARRREFAWLPWAVALGALAVHHTSLARGGTLSWTWTAVTIGVSLVPALVYLAAPVFGRGLDADARAGHERALGVGLVAALFVHLELLLFVAVAFDLDHGSALRLALSCTMASAGAALVARTVDLRWAGVLLASCAAVTAAAASIHVVEAHTPAGPWTALAALAVTGLFAAGAWVGSRAPHGDESRLTSSHTATAAAALVSLAATAWHGDTLGGDSFEALFFVVALVLAAVHASVGSRRVVLLCAASVAAALACAELDGRWHGYAAALCSAAIVLVGSSARVFAGNRSAAVGGGIALVLLFGVALPSWSSDEALILHAAPFVALGIAADVWSGRRQASNAHTSYAAAAVLVAALAIALEVDFEPPAFCAGLTALGWAALAHRRRETELIVAACITALVAPLVLVMRLVAPPYHELPVRFLLDELALVHLVPAVGALAGVLALRRRTRKGDDDLDVLGAFTGAGAVVLVLVWVSLEVIAFHTTDGPLRWPAQDAGAPQLALSTSWIAIGVALLVTGLVTRSVGARWASLGVLLAALVKVFLFDLAHLEGLARVGSLAGLALATLGVSLLYQRFVLRTSTPAN